MSNTSALDAATQDRKSRLAQLKSLKRKQPPTDDDVVAPRATNDTENENGDVKSQSPTPTPSWLSGRNYDAASRGPKLGFESAPSEGQTTLEQQAKDLALEAKRQADEEQQAEKPLDLFKLQPKKPNWDLKRDLDKKLEILNVRTDNAIAKLVRERISKAQKDAQAISGDDDTGDVAGIQGAALVGALHEREREGERERADEDNEEVEA